ncbi:MAG TPA: c-type cytochrome biogenesis protein CcmI [Pelomicrobium sp.]|nr:c-type cytochrome biogenesis protein CcmI [Pelomicrobium sp.]
MTVFWIVCVLLLAGALLIVVPPLLRKAEVGGRMSAGDANLSIYRDQLGEIDRDVDSGLLTREQAEIARASLERRAVADLAGAQAREGAADGISRRTGVAVAIALPLAVLGLYVVLGQPAAVLTRAVAPRAGEHPLGPEQVQQMVAGLAEKLRDRPDDADGWLMLARSYAALGRYRDSATAYERAATLKPDDAQLLADFADVLAMAQGKRFSGAPAAVIQSALRVDPNHPKVLALAGSAAFEARDYRGAEFYWERLLRVAPAGSPLARGVEGSIAQARRLGAQPDAPAVAAVARIEGEVDVVPELRQRASAEATVFVFARAAEGPAMPLAVVRRRVADLPFRFTLDDSQSLVPGAKLSGHATLAVGARISASGSATPGAGDLVARPQIVAPGATGVRLLIGEVQP